MGLAEWAEITARALLKDSLLRRWAHTQGVAAKARTLGDVLGDDAELVEAAAWLHDIGYAPDLHDSGFHPLDGARYLRDVEGAEPLLCRLVAHHSCALTEAEERGLSGELVREFRLAPRDLAESLIYCDMTTSPDGQPVKVGDRLKEIRQRYGPGDAVTRAITRSAPTLEAAVRRVEDRLARRARPKRPVRSRGLQDGLDIPGVGVSSGLELPVAPGGVLVVEGAGFEAAVEDADEPVGDSPQGVIVSVAAGALLVVEGAGAG